MELTPKEEAENLIKQFKPYVYCYMGSGMLSNDYDEEVALKNAKQCALITVNKIYQANINIHIAKRNIYWDEVKKEIEIYE